MFVDEVTISIQSGAGGNGCVSFRREKYVPFGGPNGGNGGRGGHVYLVATRDKMSLLDFRYRPLYTAGRGEHGMGKEMDGRAGEDLYLELPVGTQVFDDATSELLVDLAQDSQTYPIAEGGPGGKGNRAFTTSTQRAPRIATPGEPGITKKIKLELKLHSDVGLIGLPNAGKSSLLTVISRAKPKVADYPFTTLVPHLGVVEHKGTSFVVADLPGLIEGAHEGAGLGHRFLRHASRSRLLLHLVDITASLEDILKNIQTVRSEIGAYDPSLLKREERIVFTKTDLLEPLDKKKEKLRSLFPNSFFISSASQSGLSEVLDYLILVIRRKQSNEGNKCDMEF